jgi:hypothetical protein
MACTPNTEGYKAMAPVVSEAIRKIAIRLQLRIATAKR